MEMMIKIILMALATAATLAEDPTIDDEFELREALTRRTSDIRKFIRPVKGALDQAVPVQHRLALILIIDFSEDTGLFSGLFYNRLQWTDTSMTWNPSDHNGVDSLRIDTSNMWNPDITLYNNADFTAKETIDALKILYSNGDVIWIPTTRLSVLCYQGGDKDADWTCPLTFGSWVYSDDQVDLQSYATEVDLNDFRSNADWEIVGTPVERKAIFYECCVELYSRLSYRILLKSRGGRRSSSSADHTRGHLTVIITLVLAYLTY